MFEVGKPVTVWHLSMNLLPRALSGTIAGAMDNNGRWPVQFPGAIIPVSLNADENGEFWPEELGYKGEADSEA